MKCFLVFVTTLVLLSCNSAKERKEPKQPVTDRPSSGDPLLQKANWELDDYTAAVSSFKVKRQENPSSFTEYVKGDGKELFEKLVDHSGYSRLLQGDAEKDRMAFLGIANLSSDLLKLFMDTKKENGKYVLEHELIRSFIASLVLNRMTVTSIIKTYPDENALTESQKEGLLKVKTGSFQMIRGAFITIHTDYSLYEKKDIVDLARFLASHIQQMNSFLNKNLNDQIDASIEKLNNSGTYEEAKQAFAQ